jgi:hypothetical protein
VDRRQLASLAPPLDHDFVRRPTDGEEKRGLGRGRRRREGAVLERDRSR